MGLIQPCAAPDSVRLSLGAERREVPSCLPERCLSGTYRQPLSKANLVTQTTCCLLFNMHWHELSFSWLSLTLTSACSGAF